MRLPLPLRGLAPNDQDAQAAMVSKPVIGKIAEANFV